MAHDTNAFAPEDEHSVAAKIFEARMRAFGAADFDELMFRVVTLLQDEELLAVTRRRFQHMLVDEFQVCSCSWLWAHSGMPIF